MRVRRVVVLISVVAFLTLPGMSRAGNTTLFAPGVSPTAGAFQQAFSDLLAGLEGAMGLPANASTAMANASEDEVALMMQYFDDPAAFYATVLRVQGYLAEGSAAAADTTGEQKFARSLAMTAPYPPDYPSSTGLYADLVLGQLAAFDLITYASDRCDTNKLSDFYSIYYLAKKAAEQADSVCVVAGCDPTGIGCAAVCGVVEIYKIAVVTAALPLDLCEYQDNNIDSAEIQAGYENTVSLLYDLSAHDAGVRTAIAEHDSDIKYVLSQIDGKLDNQTAMLIEVLENQEKIMKLLNTPQGLRPEWPVKRPYWSFK